MRKKLEKMKLAEKLAIEAAFQLGLNILIIMPNFLSIPYLQKENGWS
jgi:hypothetical protein